MLSHPTFSTEVPLELWGLFFILVLYPISIVDDVTSGSIPDFKNWIQAMYIYLHGLL